MTNNTKIKISENPATQEVAITTSGDLVLAVSNSLKQKFIEALSAHSALTLGIKNCKEVDLSCLQLLISLQRTAARQGKSLNITTSGSDEFEKIVSNAGFGSILIKAS